MKYSKDFIEKCMNLYPGYDALQIALNNGSVYAGRFLDDGVTEIKYTEILNAVSLEKLQEKARNIEAKRNLYREWGRVYDHNYRINKEEEE